jgi:nicotinamidase-related amidase
MLSQEYGRRSTPMCMCNAFDAIRTGGSDETDGIQRPLTYDIEARLCIHCTEQKMANSDTNSQFYVPVDLGRTALLLADIQDQIASRFSHQQLEAYLKEVFGILKLFRAEIAHRRSRPQDKPDPYVNVPLIIHHIFPAGINGNAFISPYNKLAKWFAKLEASGAFSKEAADPNKPSYNIVEALRPEGNEWGTKDEIIIPKITAGCFSSSELQGYFRARGIRHVVLCGLTTAGAILGSARLGADLDFHIIVPREAVMDDDPEVNDFLLDKVLPRFVDVVGVANVEALFRTS